MVQIDGDGTNTRNLPNDESRALGVRSDGSNPEGVNDNTGNGAESFGNSPTAPRGALGARELGKQESAGNTKSSRDEDPKKSKGLSNVLKKLKKPLSAPPILLVGAGGSLLVFVGVVALILLIFLGTLTIPNLAANISGYEFATMTRQLSKSASRMAAEELSVEAAGEGTAATGATEEKPGGLFGDLKEKFGSVIDPETGKLAPVGKLFQKMSDVNGLRPSKIMANLGQDHGFTFTVKESPITGRQILKSVTLDGVEYPVEQVSGIQRWIPGWNDFVQTQNNARFYENFQPKLLEAMDVGTENATLATVVRSAAAAKFRDQVGLRLTAWDQAAFVGKDAKQARLLEARQKGNAIDDTATAADNATTEQISDTVSAVKDAEQQVMQDDSKLQQAIDNQGMAQSIDEAIANGVKESWTTDVIGFVDPLYSIAVPICIVYDGSVVQSGPTMKNAINEQLAGASYIQSAADEQKHGGGAGLRAAIEATNKDLGSAVAQSIPIIRANGGSVDTRAYGSAESGSGGGDYYDVFNALGVSPSSTVGKGLNVVVSHFCGVLTNTATAVGIGIVNTAGALITFGGTEAGEEAAGQGAAFFIKSFVSHMVEDLFATKIEQQGTKLVERSAMNRFMRFMFTQGLIIGGTVGATEFARAIVAARAAVTNGGLTQGPDLANMADAGANIMAGEICRTQMFCPPQTNSDVSKRDSADAQYLAYQNSIKSPADRYLALSNPDSLLSHLAMMAASMLRPDIAASLISSTAKFFDPLNSIGLLFGSLGIVHAAPDPSTQHYGNVQFGWTEDEERAIDSNTSYLPLQNQLILDKSGKANEIAQKYATCFGYKYDSSGDGSLDPSDPNSNMQLDVTGSGSLADLLANGDIPRDNNGDVLNNDSLCSPQNLGMNNPTYGDLVFRWMIARSNDMTMAQLTNLQTTTN